MKLKVIADEFYDKVEEVYIPKDTVIERNEKRSRQLIDAKVCEEIVEKPPKKTENEI